MKKSLVFRKWYAKIQNQSDIVKKSLVSENPALAPPRAPSAFWGIFESHFATQTKEKGLTCRLDVLSSIMPASRRFLFPEAQAGVFHVISRLAGRAYFLEEGSGREEFVKMMRAYEDVCGVEVLT